MPDLIELPAWPTCTSALKWSQDDVLAVALQDCVTLITPRLTSVSARTRAARGTWDTTTLPTSTYPEDQVPYQTHKPWTTFQIGEELSDRHTTAIEWSPPGLGKHGSCVLAVLTSDHILSCWECIGRPEHADNWRRAIILNPALVSAADKDTNTRSWRIRSFAWAPASTSSSDQFMAIAKDDGSVVIVRFSSGKTWSVRIVHTFKPFVDYDYHRLVTVLPSATKMRPPYIDQLSWGPWLYDTNTGHRSRLVFACQSQLYCATVVVTSHLVVFDPVRFLDDLPDLAGPLTWAPTGSLVTFHSKKIICNTFEDSFEPTETVSFPADLDWDNVSALGFRGPNSVLAYAPFSSLVQQTADISLSLTGDPMDTPWRQDVKDALAEWENRVDLFRLGTVKTYGLAFSPSGHHSAVAVSFHASDRLEYIIDSFKYTNISMTRLYELSEDEMLPSDASLQSVSSESLLLDLMQLGTGKSSRYDLAQMYSNYVQTTASMQPPLYHDNVAETIAQFRRRLDEAAFRRRRHDRLIQLALTEELDRVLPDLQTTTLLLTEILALPTFLSKSDTTIVDVCEKVQNHIRQRETNLDPNTSGIPEQCSTCDNELPLESLRWARCAQKHVFTRCGLSFVAIPQKHPTKSCSLCNVTYIDTPPESLDSSSLAYVLQSACTTCVYCGGRFVG